VRSGGNLEGVLCVPRNGISNPPGHHTFRPSWTLGGDPELQGRKSEVKSRVTGGGWITGERGNRTLLETFGSTTSDDSDGEERVWVPRAKIKTGDRKKVPGIRCESGANSEPGFIPETKKDGLTTKSFRKYMIWSF